VRAKFGFQRNAAWAALFGQQRFSPSPPSLLCPLFASTIGTGLSHPSNFSPTPLPTPSSPDFQLELAPPSARPTFSRAQDDCLFFFFFFFLVLRRAFCVQTAFPDRMLLYGLLFSSPRKLGFAESPHHNERLTDLFSIGGESPPSFFRRNLCLFFSHSGSVHVKELLFSGEKDPFFRSVSPPSWPSAFIPRTTRPWMGFLRDDSPQTGSSSSFRTAPLSPSFSSTTTF